MQAALLAQEASPLLNLLTASGSTYQPWAYTTRSSAPLHQRVRTTVKGKPSSELQWGSIQTHQIPRFGLLGGLTFRIVLQNLPTKDGAESFSNYTGLAAIRSVSLNTHNKTIETIPFSAALFSHSYACSATERSRNDWAVGAHTDKELAHITTGDASALAASGRTREFYYTIPFSFFQTAASTLDTSFIESLFVVTELASSGKMLKSANTDKVSVKSLDLMCEYYNVTDSLKRELQASQFPPDRSLSILNATYYEEAAQQLVVKGSTYANRQLNEISIDLKSNGVISHTYFRLVRKKYQFTRQNGTKNTVVDNSWNQGVCVGESVISYDNTTDGSVSHATEGWASFSIEASGTTLVGPCTVGEMAMIGWGGDRSKSFASNADKDTGAYSGQGTQNTDGYTVVNWGLEARPTNFCAGAQSLRECVGPRLVVKFYSPADCRANHVVMTTDTTAIDAGSIHASATGPPAIAVDSADQYEYTYELQCGHRQNGLVSIASSDGRVSSAIAS